MRSILTLLVLLFVGACYYPRAPKKFLHSPHPSTYGNLRVGQALILQRDALIESGKIYGIDEGASGSQLLMMGTKVKVVSVDLLSNINTVNVEVTANVLSGDLVGRRLKFGGSMLVGNYDKKNVSIDQTWWRNTQE